MIKIAIVEDDRSCAEQFISYMERYSKEKSETLLPRIYSDATSFLKEYNGQFDIIFMDIMLPSVNGLDAARKLRQMDDTVCLVFATSMAQLAINGYEVEAADFILKPVLYPRFSALMDKLLRRMISQRGTEITVRTPGGIEKRLYSSQISYVMIEDHLLIYHTDIGTVETWDSLKHALELLPKASFSQCSKSCVVNLDRVVTVRGNQVILKECILPLSRSRKKDFISALNTYLGSI